MKVNITPCLWFNNQAKEAAELYCSVFPDSRVTAQSPIVTEVNISGHSITLLDGGPMYQPNPSVSLQYACGNPAEYDSLWEKLSTGGSILVDSTVDKSGRFGWITDKRGVSWQLILEKGVTAVEKITPCLVFSGKQYGRAAEAIRHYATVFKGPDGGKQISLPGVEWSLVSLYGQAFALMDREGVKRWEFSEGVSLTIHCNTQEEIDYYWSRLTEGGSESMCGWLKDRFGVSWQVIPVAISAIMSDPVKAQKAAKAFMAMRKLNIEQIVQASL